MRGTLLSWVYDFHEAVRFLFFSSQFFPLHLISSLLHLGYTTHGRHDGHYIRRFGCIGTFSYPRFMN